MCISLFLQPMPIMSRLLLLAAFLFALPVTAQPDEHAMHHSPRTVSVTGSDTVSVMPDRVSVNFAVVTRAEGPEAAREQNATAARRALDAVRELGVPERQIQLQSLRLDEDVEYQNGQRIRKGFIARRDVQVTLDDLDLLPNVVAEVVEEGANELGGINYDLKDRQSAENEALRRAARRAQAKARLLAQTLGVELGLVHSIQEGSVAFPQPRPQPMYAARAMDMVEAAPEPGAYAAGEMEVRATVTAVFSLIDLE